MLAKKEEILSNIKKRLLIDFDEEDEIIVDGLIMLYQEIYRAYQVGTTYFPLKYIHLVEMIRLYKDYKKSTNHKETTLNEVKKYFLSIFTLEDNRYTWSVRFNALIGTFDNY